MKSQSNARPKWHLWAPAPASYDQRQDCSPQELWVEVSGTVIGVSVAATPPCSGIRLLQGNVPATLTGGWQDGCDRVFLVQAFGKGVSDKAFHLEVP